VEVWVYAESARSTDELLTAARRVGDRVVVFGAADDDRGLGVLPGGPVAAAVAERAAASADLILFPTSYDGRDVAGRLSARLDRPIIANGVDLVRDGDQVIVETSIFGGTTTVRTAFRGPRPWLASLRPGSFPRHEGRADETEVVRLGGTAQAAPRIVARHEEPRPGPALEEASVVVAGGRGLGSAETFALVAELARVLGGAPGATRAAVDAGWAPYAWQVGQTGQTVSPTVYLAFGLSGAAQHLVGMRGARHVIAVNRDRAAPIFSLADLGVVGDAGEILPRLIALLAARNR
jgi:electron transfer flavoprotein alpha subunit